MVLVRRGGRLNGVRFWALYYAYPIKPRFSVYRYIGFSADTGTYYFQSIKNAKCLLTRSFYQIDNSAHFRPFCLVSDELIHLNEESSRNANL